MKESMKKLSAEEFAAEIVRLSKLPLLTVDQASCYFHIGITKLYKLVKEPQHDFVVKNGSKHLIDREKFTEFLRSNREV